MSKTSPAPWEADGHEIRDARNAIIATCVPIADFASVHLPIVDEGPANARLMASAPALAAALRAVIEHHDTFMVGVIGEEFHRRYGDAPAIAEARRVLEELEA
jgi:hypothetical protein